MFNRKNPVHLSNGEIAELVRESQALCSLLTAKRAKSSNNQWNSRWNTKWNASPNLRTWFRGENIYSICDNQLHSITDDKLLDHLIAIIHRGCAARFKDIYNENKRLRRLITTLDDEKSINLLMLICISFRRDTKQLFKIFLPLIKIENITAAIQKLSEYNTPKPLQYLHNHITQLQQYITSSTAETSDIAALNFQGENPSAQTQVVSFRPIFYTPSFFAPPALTATAVAANPIITEQAMMFTDVNMLEDNPFSFSDATAFADAADLFADDDAAAANDVVDIFADDVDDVDAAVFADAIDFLDPDVNPDVDPDFDFNKPLNNSDLQSLFDLCNQQPSIQQIHR